MGTQRENKVTIRLNDAEMLKLADAAVAADLPPATYAKNALVNTIDNAVLLAALRRQEKIQMEIFRRIVVDFQMVHVKKTLEETKPISIEITKKFLESLDAEE